MPPLNVGTVKVDGKPLAHAVVTVTVTREFRLRVWAALLCVRLALWIGGGTLEVKTDG
jgi:hypothetical protein